MQAVRTTVAAMLARASSAAVALAAASATTVVSFAAKVGAARAPRGVRVERPEHCHGGTHTRSACWLQYSTVLLLHEHEPPQPGLRLARPQRVVAWCIRRTNAGRSHQPSCSPACIRKVELLQVQSPAARRARPAFPRASAVCGDNAPSRAAAVLSFQKTASIDLAHMAGTSGRRDEGMHVARDEKLRGGVDNVRPAMLNTTSGHTRVYSTPPSCWYSSLSFQKQRRKGGPRIRCTWRQGDGVLPGVWTPVESWRSVFRPMLVLKVVVVL